MYGGTFNGGDGDGMVVMYCGGTTNEVEDVQPGGSVCP